MPNVKRLPLHFVHSHFPSPSLRIPRLLHYSAYVQLLSIAFLLHPPPMHIICPSFECEISFLLWRYVIKSFTMIFKSHTIKQIWTHVISYSACCFLHHIHFTIVSRYTLVSALHEYCSTMGTAVIPYKPLF